MTTEQLLDALSVLVTDILTRLPLVARLVKRLMAKGVKLTAQQVPLLTYIRPVANGVTLPEVVTRFIGRSSLIPIIGRMSLDEQRRLADGGTVPLCIHDNKGGTTILMADPLNMTKEQVEQAFVSEGAECRLRTEAEQVLLLHAQRTKEKAKKPEIIGDLKIDPEKDGGGVWHRRGFIRKADLAAALDALK